MSSASAMVESSNAPWSFPTTTEDRTYPIGGDPTQADTKGLNGQMLKIRRAIQAELDAGAPLRDLKTGEVWDRLQSRMKEMKLRAKEVPSRSAFYRYKRQFGLPK